MIDIRPALSPLDREQVYDLRRSVLCGEMHLDRDAVRDALDEGARLLLAWDGEKPVGTGRLVWRGSAACAEMLAVLPGWRRRGIGQGLLRRLADLARQDQAATLTLVGPKGLLPFLQGLGFDVISQDVDVVLAVWVV